MVTFKQEGKNLYYWGLKISHVRTTRQKMTTFKVFTPLRQYNLEKWKLHISVWNEV